MRTARPAIPNVGNYKSLPALCPERKCVYLIATIPRVKAINPRTSQACGIRESVGILLLLIEKP